MNLRRHFLDWQKPILQQAVDFLTANWNKGPLDLQHDLIIVPTRHASRRLREALALKAAARKTAVLDGKIITPSTLFQPDPAQGSIADGILALAVWSLVLSRINAAEYPSLFPNGRLGKGLGSSTFVAEALHRLREFLCEEGYTISDVAPRITDSMEPERWAELKRLDAIYLKTLSELNLQDVCTSKIRTANAPILAKDYRRICLLFVPDPPPLAVIALEKLAKQVPIEICLHAPPDFCHAFDEWGRPITDLWTTNRRVDITDETIHITANPRDEALAVKQLVNDAGPQLRPQIAIGAIDTSLTPFLENALEDIGAKLYHPEGETAEHSSLFQLVSRLLELEQRQDYRSFAALLRHPHYLDFLAHRIAKFDPAEFLRSLDQFQQKHLPSAMDNIRQFLTYAEYSTTTLATTGNIVTQQIQQLKSTKITDSLPLLLAEIYDHRLLKPNSPVDDRFAVTANILNEALAALKPVAEFPGFTNSELTRLLTKEISQRRISLEREPHMLDALGWLELPWEDAPLLLLTGMTDDIIPEATVGHVFLPDSARTQLGLRDNLARFARDTYLLTTLIRCRPAASLHFFLSRTNSLGDPLKPSRLLLLTDESTLPTRVLRFFTGVVEGQHQHHPPAIGWKLCPPPPASLPIKTARAESFRVTMFRDYLSCPFRFYLKYKLRMKKEDDSANEMDRPTYGSITHQILESFGNHKRLADSADESTIAAFLFKQIDELFAHQYGDQLTIPLKIQQEALKQQMLAFARVQAQERAAGWRIIHTEKDFHLNFGKSVVTGRVDRIEQNLKTNEMRLLDYKTADNINTPVASHLANLNSTTADYALVHINGKTRRWIDLQLPLYRLYAEKEFKQQVSCGYLALPSATNETAVLLWAELDEELLSQAEKCAAAVIDRVQNNVFWPPAGRPKYDDFADILLGDPLSSIEWHQEKDCR